MGEHVRILFVDDEPNVLKALQRVFLDDDYDILTAPSGFDGLRVLEKTDPVQIVISDFRMPEMNGVEFLREVRNRWPATIRIVLSGYADAAAIVSAINDGQVYRFIPKPWNEDELRTSVAAAVERYSRQSDRNRLEAESNAKDAEIVRLREEIDRLSGGGKR